MFVVVLELRRLVKIGNLRNVKLLRRGVRSNGKKI